MPAMDRHVIYTLVTRTNRMLSHEAKAMKKRFLNPSSVGVYHAVVVTKSVCEPMSMPTLCNREPDGRVRMVPDITT
jgi:hypothetical protein